MLPVIDEEEDDGDEIASITLQIHRLRAEKVRLQEAVSSKQALIEEEVAAAKSELQKLRSELLDLDLSASARGRFRPPQPAQKVPRFDPREPQLLFEIETSERQLAELRQRITDDDAQKSSEITKMMNRARRLKSKFDQLVEDNDALEDSFDDKRAQIEELKAKIRAKEVEGREAEAEAAKKEQKLAKLANRADGIVSRVYRGKSKYC
jgi:predicted  nucleic acid-binding Zn-ribbon protein